MQPSSVSSGVDQVITIAACLHLFSSLSEPACWVGSKALLDMYSYQATVLEQPSLFACFGCSHSHQELVGSAWLQCLWPLTRGCVFASNMPCTMREQEIQVQNSRALFRHAFVEWQKTHRLGAYVPGCSHGLLVDAEALSAGCAHAALRCPDTCA